MCVADVARQEVSVCVGESVNTYFSVIKIKEQKYVQYITTIGTIYCVAVILPA